MKKIIIILAGILLGVYALLFVMSIGSEYYAEKIFYRMMKTAQEITQNPDVVPPGLVASAENDLKKIEAKYPKTKTAKAAEVLSIDLYLALKEYDKTLNTLDQLQEKYGDDPAFMGRTQYIRAIVYEAQKKWDKAVEQYKLIEKEYENTPLGMRAPLLIADMYSKSGQPAKAEAAYAVAIAKFHRIMKEQEGKVIALLAAGILVDVYIHFDRNAELADLIEEVVKRYPSGEILARYMPLAEFVMIKKLDDKPRVIKLYEHLRDSVENEKGEELFSKRIEMLQTMDTSSPDAAPVPKA